MTRERLTLFDTTLRDGAQTTGVDFSLDDKRQIAAMLDDLGVDYIEGGYPGANPLDTEFFAKRPTLRARFAAFGMTRRQGRSVDNDPGVAALLDARLRCRDLRRQELGLSGACRACAPRSRTISTAFAIGRGRRRARQGGGSSIASISSTATRRTRITRWHAPRPPYEAGARWIVLCDTNGGTLPHEVERIVAEVANVIPGERARHSCA